MWGSPGVGGGLHGRLVIACSIARPENRTTILRCRRRPPLERIDLNGRIASGPTSTLTLGLQGRGIAIAGFPHFSGCRMRSAAWSAVSVARPCGRPGSWWADTVVCIRSSHVQRESRRSSGLPTRGLRRSRLNSPASGSMTAWLPKSSPSSLALPAQVSVPLLPGRGRPRKYMSMARPTGVRRAGTHMRFELIRIEGVDSWEAAARNGA